MYDDNKIETIKRSLEESGNLGTTISGGLDAADFCTAIPASIKRAVDNYSPYGDAMDPIAWLSTLIP